MKQITLFALGFILFSTAHAQFSKGDRYLSGYFGAFVTDYNLADSQQLDSYGISFAPAFIKFKSDKKAFGFKLAASFSHAKVSNNSNDQTINGTGFGAGIFWQRYLPLGKGFYLVGETGIDGSFTHTLAKNTLAPASKVTTNSYGASIYLSPGLGYKLSERLIIGLNFSSIAALGYTYNRQTTINGTITNRYTTSSIAFASSVNNTTVGNLGITFGWKLK